MSSADVVYVPNPSANPADELSVLIDAYCFILETEKKGGCRTLPNRPDDPRKDEDARTYFYST